MFKQLISVLGIAFPAVLWHDSLPAGVAAYICTRFSNEGGEGMRQVLYGIAVASLGLALVVTFPHAAWGFPAFQRLPSVSDGEPFCAACHSSVDASYHPELQAEASQAAVYTTKHYKALEEGLGGY